MILYEYKCSNCSAVFQEEVKKNLISCPSCKGAEVEKLWATVSKSTTAGCAGKCGSCGGCKSQ